MPIAPEDLRKTVGWGHIILYNGTLYVESRNEEGECVHRYPLSEITNRFEGRRIQFTFEDAEYAEDPMDRPIRKQPRSEE